MSASSTAVTYINKKRRNADIAPASDTANAKAAKTPAPPSASSKASAAGAADTPASTSTPLAEQQQSREDAIAYLATYATSKEAWKFNKKTQTYLLKWFAHRAGCHSLPKSSFDHFLLYIQGMQGAAAVQLLASAKAVLSENVAKYPALAQEKSAAAAAKDGDENDAAAVALKEARRECMRARKVVQVVETATAAAAAAAAK